MTNKVRGTTECLRKLQPQRRKASKIGLARTADISLNIDPRNMPKPLAHRSLDSYLTGRRYNVSSLRPLPLALAVYFVGNTRDSLGLLRLTPAATLSTQPSLPADSEAIALRLVRLVAMLVLCLMVGLYLMTRRSSRKCMILSWKVLSRIRNWRRVIRYVVFDLSCAWLTLCSDTSLSLRSRTFT